MSTEHIRNSIERTISYLEANPTKAIHKDPPVTAALESGLKIRVKGRNGEEAITDMPPSIGGEGSAPSPGWLMKAALATCTATVIATKAALEGFELSTLEVSIESETDIRGLVFVDESIKAGPLTLRTHVRIGSKGIAEEKLHEIVNWAADNSWVGNAICRAVPIKTDVEIV